MKKLLFVLITAIILCTALAVISFAATVVQSGSCGENVTYTLDSDGVFTISGSGAMADYSSSSSAPWYSKRSSVKSVIIKNGVTSIGDWAFEDCTSLTSVTIPDSVTSICEGAFGFCDSLTNVTIGNGVTSIGDYAFGYCDSLTSVTIPDSVTSIGDYAFYNCDSLTSVTIGNSVTSIGYCAFEGCTSLTSVTIPNSVTSIGVDAFIDCTSLTSVTIPDSVTSIGGAAFGYYCNYLNDVYELIEGFVINGYEGSAAETYANNNGITFISKIIASGSCGTNVTYTLDSDGVLTISGSGAMADYSSSSSAPWYSKRSSVKSVIIKNGVTSIGDYAFYECSSLTSVTIPDSVKAIGFSAFSYTAYYNDSNNWVNGVLYIGNHLIKANKSISGSYRIKDGTTCIAVQAFCNCTDLTTVTIPNSVEVICDGAFGRCTALTSVVIPEKVTTIGSDVFYWCTSLTSVTIPDGVISIGSNAFCNCPALKSVTIPDSVTNIDQYALGYYFDYDYPEMIIVPGFVINGYKGSAAETYANDNGITFKAISKITIIDSGSCGDNVTYTLDSDGVLTISGSGAMTSYSYDGAPWYSNRSSIKSVIIEDGVTSIGSFAFYDCTSLTSVTIPNSVISVSNYAFEYCTGLTSVTIGNGVTSIGDNAFYSCTGLTSVYITDIAAWCNINFYSSYSNPLCHAKNLYLNGEVLTELVIPDGVTSIGDYAFYSCDSLTSVTITDSVTSIGDGAFYYCIGLTSVTIPDSVTSIGDGAFYSCDSLTSVTIGNGVTSIGDYAFYSCDSLTSVTITDSVKSIGDHAFYSCDSLTSVTIGNGVTSIGDYAFYSCDSLTSVYITDIAAWCNINFYSSYSNPLGHAKNLYLNGEVLTELVIPDGVTSIGDYAFYSCDSLTSVTIPDSVTSIGDGAFYYCIGLTSVTIPDSVTSIASNAFYHCTSLTSVTIPDSVTSIGEAAFRDCTSLTSVTIPDSVTSIGNYAFRSCTGLTCVTIGNSVTGIGKNAFLDCTSLTSVTIPESLTSIGSYAFGYYYYKRDYVLLEGFAIHGYEGSAAETYANDNGITFKAISKVTIIDSGSCGENVRYTLDSDGVLTISGSGAMKNYSSSFSGVNSITTAPWGAKYSSIKTVKIADGVTNVGAFAFLGCTELTSVNLGNGVESIGNYAFRECIGLANIWVDENNPTYSSDENGILYNKNKTTLVCCPMGITFTEFDIPDGVTSIGDSAFEYCSNLTSVKIENSVTNIGNSAFFSCTGLTSVKIGNSVTSIGTSAFYACSALTSVDIGNGVIDINKGAFYGCSSLTSVTIPNSVTSIGSSAFDYCDYLTSITISDSVTSIGEHAFGYYYDNGYKLIEGVVINGYKGSAAETYAKNNGITFNALIKIIDSGYCGENVRFTLDSDGVLTISGSGAMDYTSVPWYSNRALIKTVIIEDGVTSIGADAFYYCDSLTSVTIANSVVSIGDWAFAFCNALTSIVISDGVESIGENAFYGCSNLADMTIGKGVTSIGASAFCNCSALAKVTIPESVASIGEYAFCSCEKLKAVTVLSKTVTIGKRALGCKVKENSSIVDGFILYGFESSTAQKYANTYGITFRVCNPDGTTYIAKGAIGDVNWAITSDGILTVSGEGAIPDYTRAVTAPWTAYAKQITKVIVGDGITSIGNYAFYNLTKVTSLEMADSVNYLGIQFIRGTAIEEINVNARTVAVNAFGRADSLKVINFTENFKNALGNIFYSETVTIKAPENSFAHKYAEAFNDKFNTSATVTYASDGTTAKSPVARFGSMGDNVFYAMYQNTKGNWKMVVSGSGNMKNFPYYSEKNEAKGYTFCPTYYMSKESVNTKIYSIEVLDGVTTIGNYAFYLCTKATSVTLPDGITSIGQGAFRTCAKLTSITLPESVTKIGANAFNGCTALTNVNIPDAVETIGNNIFVKCTHKNLSVTTSNRDAINYIKSTYPAITIVNN